MKKPIVLLILAAALTVAFVQKVQMTLIPGKGIEGYVTVDVSTSTEIKTKFGTDFKMIDHYIEREGFKSLFSIEHAYASQGVSFFFKPNRDTIFALKVKKEFNGKTDKGIVAGKSTMQDVRGAYGSSEFFYTDVNMGLEYPGITFYCPVEGTEAKALKSKVSAISINEFEK